MKSLIQGAAIESGSSILDIVVEVIMLRRKLFSAAVPSKCVLLMLLTPLSIKRFIK